MKKLGASAIGGAVNVVDTSFKVVEDQVSMRQTSCSEPSTKSTASSRPTSLAHIDKNRDGVASADELRATANSSRFTSPPRLADVEAKASPHVYRR